MSKEYLYVFGYETPSERSANTEVGTDFESSAAVFIVAENEGQALEWGQEVSERFVRWLHNDVGVSWKKYEFAFWVERDPEEFVRRGTYSLSEIPVVRLGEYPDFRRL